MLPQIMPLEVSALYIYPVKSCRAVPVSSAWVGLFGFELDRFWMVVDASTGRFLTQREHPKMVLIQPELVVNQASSGSTESGLGAYGRGGKLVLSVRGQAGNQVEVPFRTSVDKTLSRTASIWKDLAVDCFDEGDEVATFLSEYLQTPVRLVVKDRTKVRGLLPAVTPARKVFDHQPQTAFADGFPFLLLSEASVADLNTRLASEGKVSKPITALNFRPNIVVKGCAAFEEDTWKRIRIGRGNATAELFVVSRCTRCQIPSNDLDEGRLGPEPTKTLMSYRRVDPAAKYQACFGMNCTQRYTGWQASVGDAIEVLETTLQHDRRGKDINPTFWSSVEDNIPEPVRGDIIPFVVPPQKAQALLERERRDAIKQLASLSLWLRWDAAMAVVGVATIIVGAANVLAVNGVIAAR